MPPQSVWGATSMATTFSLSTDQGVYAPGTTAYVTAVLDVGDTVDFVVAHVADAGNDGIRGTADDVLAYDLLGTGAIWTVTDGGAGDLDGVANGTVLTSWSVNQDALDQFF